MTAVRAVAAAATTGILVGTGIVATRFVIDQTTPTALALLRYAIGVAFLLPPVLMLRRLRIARRDLVPIALLGIGQFGALIVLLNYGLQHVSSARAAIIFSTLPLLTLILAASLRLEALTRAKLVGVLLTIAGVGMALGEKLGVGGGAHSVSAAFDSASGKSWLGELAVLASALCGAVCSIFYRPYVRRYDALGVGTVAMVASVLVLGLAAWAEGSIGGVPRITLHGWAAVVFIGVSSAAGYYLWLWALAHASPTRVTVFLALSPLTAAVLGAAILDESVSAGLAIGLVLVAGGLWVAHRD